MSRDSSDCRASAAADGVARAIVDEREEFKRAREGVGDDTTGRDSSDCRAGAAADGVARLIRDQRRELEWTKSGADDEATGRDSSDWRAREAAVGVARVMVIDGKGVTEATVETGAEADGNDTGRDSSGCQSIGDDMAAGVTRVLGIEASKAIRTVEAWSGSRR